jgi:hypothetical protein
VDTNERLKEARKTIGEKKTVRLEKENTERLEKENTALLENENTERLEDLVTRGHMDPFSFLACSYHLYWLIAL